MVILTVEVRQKLVLILTVEMRQKLGMVILMLAETLKLGVMILMFGGDTEVGGDVVNQQNDVEPVLSLREPDADLNTMQKERPLLLMA